MSDATLTSPLKAIRAKCLDCCCGQANEVKLCATLKCPLHPFRMGKNPYRTRREYTEEERAAARERLAKNLRQKVDNSEANDFR